MSKSVFSLLAIASTLIAKDYELFNANQKELIELNKTKVISEGAKSKLSLIKPITLSGSINYNNSANSDNITTITKYGVTFSQDIFRFGGLYFAYQYASKSQDLSLLNLNISNNTKYLSLIQNVINIRINRLKLTQTELKIENKNYEISRYKQRYRAGEIDISFLNNSILAKNSLLSSKLQLQNQIQSLKIALSKLSDKNEEQITLPIFKKLDKSSYINSSYTLLKATKSIEVSDYKHLATMSNYFPKIALNASYGIQTFDNGIDDTAFSVDYDNQNYYSYGVSISMPLDFANTFNTLENTKVKYLSAKIEQIQTKANLEADYKNYELNMDVYKDKIELSRQNIKMYEDIIIMTKAEVDGGFKLLSDLKTLQNSKKSEEIAIEIDKLYIKLELAKAYYAVR